MKLFASAGDEGSVQVFWADVGTEVDVNAVIVPLKVLKGHRVVDSLGMFLCLFVAKDRCVGSRMASEVSMVDIRRCRRQSDIVDLDISRK